MSTKSLENLKKKFSNWRQNKINHSEKTPDSLIQESLELCEVIPISVVCKELQLNHGTIKRLLLEKTSRKAGSNSKNVQTISKQNSAKFLELKLSSPPASQSSVPLAMLVTNSGKLELSLQGSEDFVRDTFLKLLSSSF